MKKKSIMKINILTIAMILTALVPNISGQSKEVKIYLQKDVDLPNNMIRTDWVSVKRTVDAKSPLRSALEWLFEPKITPEEEKQKIYEVTFGMKFEGVGLKNGTATVSFSETKNSNYGTSGGGIFSDAIKKTVKQFRTVKRVKICVVGETNIDGEYERKLFKPCK